MKNRKTFLTLTLSIVAVMIIYIGVLILIFRFVGMESAQTRTKISADILRESLTSHMVGGSSEHQDSFLKQIEQLDGIRSAWVVRSPKLVQQYGKGIYSQEVRDDIDRAVLRDGKLQESFTGSILSDNIYRLSIPYVATDQGKIDCLSCHDAKAGEILGVVSIEMEINDVKTTGLWAALVGIILLVGATTYLIVKVRRFIRSYQMTLEGVKTAMEGAERGDYSYRLDESDIVDGYHAAMWTNAVLDKMEKVFYESSSNMESLVHISFPNSDPLYTLQAGIKRLVEVEKFRSAIEQDHTIEEVYERMIALLRTRWNLRDFNILELNAISKNIHVIHTEKTLLCDAKSGCRADRTMSIVDSTQCDVACPKMIDPLAHYVCRSFPIVDDMDIVVSMVSYDLRDIPQMRLAQEQLSNFINASRLQIINKKLQQSIRIDSLTMLHNRRYLEELSELIVAQSKQTAIPYGILMVDMDGFDAINQSYDTNIADEVIKAIGRNIQEATRVSDIVIRYGGDTFAVILYDWSAHDSMDIAETIRLSFKKKIRVNTYAILKTVSIGIAFFPLQTNEMLDAIEFAKRALLEAKHLGGNCCVVYDQATMPI